MFEGSKNLAQPVDIFRKSERALAVEQFVVNDGHSSVRDHLLKHLLAHMRLEAADEILAVGRRDALVELGGDASETILPAEEIRGAQAAGAQQRPVARHQRRIRVGPANLRRPFAPGMADLAAHFGLGFGMDKIHDPLPARFMLRCIQEQPHLFMVL